MESQGRELLDQPQPYDDEFFGEVVREETKLDSYHPFAEAEECERLDDDVPVPPAT